VEGIDFHLIVVLFLRLHGGTEVNHGILGLGVKPCSGYDSNWEPSN
jgi:hypothetical protein